LRSKAPDCGSAATATLEGFRRGLEIASAQGVHALAVGGSGLLYRFVTFGLLASGQGLTARSGR
jgi:hypothetical protein